MLQTLGAAGRAVGGCKCPTLQTADERRSRRLPVCFAKQGSSPWSTGPGQSRGSSGSKAGTSKGSKSSSTTKGKQSSKSSSSTRPSKNSSKRSGSSRGKGFAPQPPQKAAAVVHKLTAPLTTQLLDDLSGWEMVPAPLWGTFTGHCEGEWLGQYSAYTPWGGDPEPVWADESGAYLLYAYSRASETREQVPVDIAAVAAAEQLDLGPTAAAAAAAADAEGSDVELEVVDMLMRKTLRSASVSSLIGGTSANKAAAAAAAERAAASAAANTAAAVAGVPETDTAAAAEDDGREGFAYNRDGSVVFNGGSYSIGPEVLDAPAVADDFEIDPEDEETLAAYPFSTVIIEQSLVAAGDARLRLVATLKLRQVPGEQELDVEPARLLLYKEHWYGTAESTSGLRRKPLQQQQQQQQQVEAAPSSSSPGGHVLQLLPSHKFDIPMVNLVRPQPQQLAGSWNVFVVAANPIVEENPDTLEDEEVLVYSSREERQQWHVPGLTSSAALGSSITSSSSSSSSSNGASDGREGTPAAAAAEFFLDDDGSGGSFWLPAGAVVTVKMAHWPPSSGSSSCSGIASGSNSIAPTNGTEAGSSSARGLMVGLHWLVDDGSCLFVERQYDGEGQLAEVRHGTAVKGGWSGGRM